MEFNLYLQKYKFPFILASKICGIFVLKERKAQVPCKAYVIPLQIPFSSEPNSMNLRFFSYIG